MNQAKDSIEISKEIRKLTLKMIYNAKASHIGGAFSMADILAVLYNNILKIDPMQPRWTERDRFFLSKGHACTSLYAVLAVMGFFPFEELDTYASDGSIFLSHTSHKVPGVELSTGSLGHALAVACGTALACIKKGENWRTFVLLSDGELDEGSNWESILFAPHHKLHNLTIIIDYNKIQSFGTIANVLQLEPIRQKLEAFGWEVMETDGHDHLELLEAFRRLPLHHSKPSAIIAHTIKGKGVDFMEDQLLWHYRSPSKEQYEQAVKQIDR
jgi:transketolase